MKKSQAKKLHEEAQRCFRVADRTADNKVAAALLAYASELEQRARLIESAKKTPNGAPLPLFITLALTSFANLSSSSARAWSRF